MKNSNINLEAKPGMILTAPTPAPKNNRKRRQNDDEDKEESAKKNPSGKIKGANFKNKSIITPLFKRLTSVRINGFVLYID